MQAHTVRVSSFAERTSSTWLNGKKVVDFGFPVSLRNIEICELPPAMD
ncbi:MAG TPA: hypothetical protein VK608_01595 [Edaphobacter sp.]|nr:hypothetical protein [Edaphobacter sp.]